MLYNRCSRSHVIPFSRTATPIHSWRSEACSLSRKRRFARSCVWLATCGSALATTALLPEVCYTHTTPRSSPPTAVPTHGNPVGSDPAVTLESGVHTKIHTKPSRLKSSSQKLVNSKEKNAAADYRPVSEAPTAPATTTDLSAGNGPTSRNGILKRSLLSKTTARRAAQSTSDVLPPAPTSRHVQFALGNSDNEGTKQSVAPPVSSGGRVLRDCGILSKTPCASCPLHQPSTQDLLLNRSRKSADQSTLTEPLDVSAHSTSISGASARVVQNGITNTSTSPPSNSAVLSKPSVANKPVVSNTPPTSRALLLGTPSHEPLSSNTSPTNEPLVYSALPVKVSLSKNKLPASNVSAAHASLANRATSVETLPTYESPSSNATPSNAPQTNTLLALKTPPRQEPPASNPALLNASVTNSGPSLETLPTLAPTSLNSVPSNISPASNPALLNTSVTNPGPSLETLPTLEPTSLNSEPSNISPASTATLTCASRQSTTPDSNEALPSSVTALNSKSTSLQDASRSVPPANSTPACGSSSASHESDIPHPVSGSSTAPLSSNIPPPNGALPQSVTAAQSIPVASQGGNAVPALNPAAVCGSLSARQPLGSTRPAPSAHSAPVPGSSPAPPSSNIPHPKEALKTSIPQEGSRLVTRIDIKATAIATKFRGAPFAQPYQLISKTLNLTTKAQD